jgi:cytochrome c oxidase subunit 2
MSDDNDQELAPIIAFVFGIAIFASLVAIAIALSTGGVFSRSARRAPAPEAAKTAAPTAAAAASDSTIVVAPVKIYFALGASDLPADAPGTLLPIIVAVKVDGSKKVVLSGYHDASGNASKNADLARDRAKAVREALKAAGVQEDRIVMQKPTEVLGGSDPQDARRVDVSLQ